MSWWAAYLLTQAVEVPIYLYAGRRMVAGRRWLLAVGASTVTHPVVWFAFPWETSPWVLCFVLAESFAVIVEGGLGKRAGLARPWIWSVAANGASAAIGLAVNWTLPAA